MDAGAALLPRPPRAQAPDPSSPSSASSLGARLLPRSSYHDGPSFSSSPAAAEDELQRAAEEVCRCCLVQDLLLRSTTPTTVRCSEDQQLQAPYDHGPVKPAISGELTPLHHDGNCNINFYGGDYMADKMQMRTKQVPHVPFCSVRKPAPKVYKSTSRSDVETHRLSVTNFIRIYTSYLLGGGMIFIILKSFLYRLPNISGPGNFEDCCSGNFEAPPKEEHVGKLSLSHGLAFPYRSTPSCSHGRDRRPSLHCSCSIGALEAFEWSTYRHGPVHFR